jgi:hypothetical protein
MDDAHGVRIRLPKASVDLEWDDAQALIGRLHAAGAKGAAEAIENRAPTGALLTHKQMIDAWNAIHDWIGEEDARLGTVERLRDALILELPEIGQQEQ